MDALAFELDTSGGVELTWSYNFNFGFGVSLQKGFFFQLNPNVTYTNWLPTAGTPEIGLALDVRLKPGTTLAGSLFFLNIAATTNNVEDYNRDGIINDGSTAVGHGPVLNEAVAQFDFNRDGGYQRYTDGDRQQRRWTTVKRDRPERQSVCRCGQSR